MHLRQARAKTTAINVIKGMLTHTREKEIENRLVFNEFLYFYKIKPNDSFIFNCSGLTGKTGGLISA